MAGKSVDKFVVMASGKIGGKTHVWTAAVFNDVKQARPWVALLKLARTAGDAKSVAEMDVHAPEVPEGQELKDVRYSGTTIQYAPEAGCLDDDTLLG